MHLNFLAAIHSKAKCSEDWQSSSFFNAVYKLILPTINHRHLTYLNYDAKEQKDEERRGGEEQVYRKGTSRPSKQNIVIDVQRPIYISIICK